MVRTKKQLIEKYTKSQNQPNDFHSLYPPQSPVPLIFHEKEISASFLHLNMTAPETNEKAFFQPPYVMNNFWPPPEPQVPITKAGQKIESMFSNICKNEINEMLVDCGYNEDDVILKLITQTGYLDIIRQRILLNSSEKEKEKSTTRSIETKPERKTKTIQSERIDDTKTASESLPQLPQQPQQQKLQPKLIYVQPKLPLPPLQIPLQKPGPVLAPAPAAVSVPVTVSSQEEEIPNKIKSATSTKESNNNNALSDNNSTGDTVSSTLTTPDSNATTSPNTISNSGKKQHRSGSRLTLDDALKQINENKGDDINAFEGWSSARLRAYKMIEKNPNSYYYRFNAPGEQQRKGKWSDEETDLFLKRLKEVGANSQWGIFSMSIPGRVGYQCSNYYRFMIESGHLHDPNYVLDQNGKARYLFDKKTSDGNVEKTFRKHSKHHNPVQFIKQKVYQKESLQSSDDESDYDDDPTYSITGSKKRKKSSSSKSKKKKNTKKILTRNALKQLKKEEEEEEEEAEEEENQNTSLSDHVVPI